MTAEVCVMNRIGVALAADSAVTIGDGKKIHTSADKLFVLTEDDPIGIMVFGLSTLDGIPWETVIKIYREQRGRNKFGTISEYARDFVAFLEDNNDLFTDEIQKNYLQLLAYVFFEKLKTGIKLTRIRAEAGDKERKRAAVRKMSDSDILRQLIDEKRKSIENSQIWEELPDDFQDQVKTQYWRDIVDISAKVFEQFADKNIDSDLESARNLFIDSLISRGGIVAESGIVIAGYGTDQYFPSMIELSVQSIIGKQLLFCYKQEKTISDPDDTSYVVSFAQHDMVQSFMYGIDKSFRDIINQTTKKTMRAVLYLIDDVFHSPKCEDLLPDEFDIETLMELAIPILEKYLEEHEYTDYYEPVVSTVATLPKDELGAMAGMLVNLTKFRRKMSINQLETVGGPIDVAVITKGDGFVWLQRKNYFEADLNPRFMARYGGTK